MENNTDKIVQDLVNLDPDNESDNKSDNGSDNGSDKICKRKQEKNKKICRLLNKYIKNFYDNIHIPYHFFREINGILIKH